jgi:hypothetical protein
VLLIAALSGAGAVNTAYNAYEWREKLKGRPVTDSSIAMTESALKKAREDLHARQRELENLQANQGEEATSFLSRLVSSKPGARGKPTSASCSLDSRNRNQHTYNRGLRTPLARNADATRVDDHAKSAADVPNVRHRQRSALLSSCLAFHRLLLRSSACGAFATGLCILLS